jgi:hypothetical protein
MNCVTVKITRLPPRDFDLRKRPIGNSGAFFYSSLISVGLSVLKRFSSTLREQCILLDSPYRLLFRTIHRCGRLVLCNRQVASQRHRHHCRRDVRIDQGKRKPSTFNSKTTRIIVEILYCTVAFWWINGINGDTPLYHVGGPLQKS